MSSTEAVALEALLLEVRERLSRIEERLKPLPRCFPPKEAAQQLGVSLTVVKEMIARGDLATARVGRRPMVPLTELERVSTPDAKRPTKQREQRAAGWKTIQKGRAR